MIENGTFADIYVGDYIESPTKTYGTGNGDKVRWLIADIDNYLYTGCNGSDCPTINGSTDGILTKHHVTIIPAKPLQNAAMNTNGGTTCGYAGSDMVGILTKGDNACTPTGDTTGLGAADSTLHEIYTQYIQPDFGDTNVLQYQNLLSNKTDDTATNNRMGGSNRLGASSGWTWYPRKLDLMSEMNVYGGIVASSSIYDTGIDNRQYAIFRLKPELMYSYNGQTFYYWLKDVASKTDFAGVDCRGYSRTYGASTLLGVRPRFLIG